MESFEVSLYYLFRKPEYFLIHLLEDAELMLE